MSIFTGQICITNIIYSSKIYEGIFSLFSHSMT